MIYSQDYATLGVRGNSYRCTTHRRRRIGRRVAFFFRVDGRVFLIRFTYPAEMRNYSRRKRAIFIRSSRTRARTNQSHVPLNIAQLNRNDFPFSARLKNSDLARSRQLCRVARFKLEFPITPRELAITRCNRAI